MVSVLEPVSAKCVGIPMTFGKLLSLTEKELGIPAAIGKTNDGSDVAAFIEKLRSGDENAFEELVDRFAAEVYGLLYRMTSNCEEAADLTQDTFMKALVGIKNFRGESNLRTWLFRIAINESRNRNRWWHRRKRGSMISLESPVGNTELSLIEAVPFRGENAEESLLRKEREQALEAALLELPAAFREAVILRDVEGLSYEETAEVLQTNIGTVKSRIARGRNELRRRLKDL